MKLGVQYAEGVICGSNARCVALLSALRQVTFTDFFYQESSREIVYEIKNETNLHVLLLLAPCNAVEGLLKFHLFQFSSRYTVL